MHFAVKSSEVGDTLTISPQGEFDLAGVPEFHRACTDGRDGHPEVVVDLRNLSFMDAAALREIVALHERSQRDVFELTVIAPPHPASRVIEITRMDERLPLVRA